jgi:putative salt-induced outer membrane protein YdiY
MRKSIYNATMLLLLLPGVYAQADSVLLQGGERLIGRIIREEAGKLIFESQNLGRFEIPRERVEKIEHTPAAPGAVAVPAIAPTGPFLPWLDPETGTNKFDWIQLKSSEWLKGRLKSLQDDEVEFDSDKFDRQEFDWEDVWQVYSPRQNETLFENKTKVSGPIHITRQQVKVQTAQGEQTFDRGELIAVTPGGPREINYWSGKLSAGLTLRSGNTEQTDFNVSAELKRSTPDTRFTLDYLANLSELANEETANNNRITAQFDFWLSRHLYLKIPFAEYYRDPFQNIKHRATAGAGVGYEFIHRPRLKWDVVIGPAYQQIWYDSVVPGEPTSKGNPAALFQTILDTKITDRLDFTSQYQVILTQRENGGYTHHWQNTFEIKLTYRLDLDVSFIWDRVSSPATSSAGTASDPNDFRTILSLGVNF